MTMNITRKDAIKTLHELWRETNDSWYKEVFNMAIDALSESSGDLISRADAIELCAEAQGRASTKSELKGISKVWQGLLKLPSAEAEWIPCSERLPSEDGYYLVQMSWWGSQMNVYSWADGWNCHRINGRVSRLSEIDGRDIVAWQPLPEPYREDGESNV